LVVLGGGPVDAEMSQALRELGTEAGLLSGYAECPNLSGQFRPYVVVETAQNGGYTRGCLGFLRLQLKPGHD
jgi:hypothetical protein